MLDIVKQVIDFYFKTFSKPELNDIKVNNKELLKKTWSVFVTLYVNWLIRWSAWNIQKIKENLVLELIENTFEALNDKRFKKINLEEKKNLKIRIDEIVNRWKPLADWEIKKINPSKSGVFVIKTDYTKAWVILPNISARLITGSDFLPVLSKKLWEKFEDKNYIVYKIETRVIEK